MKLILKRIRGYVLFDKLEISDSDARAFSDMLVEDLNAQVVADFRYAQVMVDCGEEVVLFGVSGTGEAVVMTTQPGMVHMLGVGPGSGFGIDSWYVVRDLEENEGVEWL